jgi:hypothetical protein
MGESGNRSYNKPLVKMFGITPEGSGMKNVLKGYFSYMEQNHISNQIPEDKMADFCIWYFNIRLRSQPKIDKAIAVMSEFLIATKVEHPTLTAILLGLLYAEDQRPIEIWEKGDMHPNSTIRRDLQKDKFGLVLIQWEDCFKIISKFPNIPESILGIDAYKYCLFDLVGGAERCPPKATPPPQVPLSSKKKKIKIKCPYCDCNFNAEGVSGEYQIPCPEADCGVIIDVRVP